MSESGPPPGSDAPDTLEDPLALVTPLLMRGRRALVCGGGLSGVTDGSVGFSSSWLLAQHGARVAVFDRDEEAAARTVSRITAAGGEAFAVLGDATDDEDCRRAVDRARERFGGLDTLVNSVGGADRDGIFDATPERWDQIIRTNLTSAWLITRNAEPHLGAGSSIVHVSSAGAKSPGPGMPYSVAKAGLENLVLGAAATLGPRGIRVNAVQVGMIWSSFAARGMSQELRERRRAAVSLQQEGNVWDVAAAVLFLSSGQARWISGQVLAVNGGGPYYGGGGVSASASSASATAASSVSAHGKASG
jgi:NAD(P)-dependent dehydrogenase (short-subunit alcohol dehydrogenase family)